MPAAAAPANGGATQALEMIKLAREFAAEGETDGWAILARALEKFSEPAAAMLTRAAQSRGAPAAALVDIVPPEELADFVRHDDPLSEMALLDPRVTLHAEWFGAVLDLLREHFAADATGTGTETDADSDARATS